MLCQARNADGASDMYAVRRIARTSILFLR